MTSDPGALPGPRRRYGQHFLTDPRALDRIVDALDPGPGDTVVEIGPGRGALTDRLAGRCARLVAIEIDRDLARYLRDRYRERPSVEVVAGDALEVDWGALARGPYLLAGNLPYYITTPLLFRILASPRPARAVLLVQREVAVRLVAHPGTREFGALTVNVQATAAVSVIARVSGGSFNPRPAVDSAIVSVVPLERPLVAPDEEEDFRRMVQALFGMRRKQLVRVLREVMGWDAGRAAVALAAEALDPATRAETLSPAALVRLHARLRHG